MPPGKGGSLGKRTVTFLVVAVAWLPAQEYAGSAACATCHARIASFYAKSAMGRSVSLASAHVTKGGGKTAHTGLARTFEVSVREGALYQKESGAEFANEHQLAYAIGSGIHGISFAVRRGDHLFQAPLSWYARTQTWELSPGYEHADYAFNRPIAEGCIACHSGRPRVAPFGSGKFLDPPFAEMAIGCENCHGPGKAHIAAGGAKRNIVNPARLSIPLADDICRKCHQGGDARVLLPGKTEADFRPGKPLGDVLGIFKAARTGDVDLLEHHDAMEASRCFQASGKISCHTCHNPHAEKVDFNAKCVSCHTPHRASEGGCVACHMPRREVGFIAHAALTNHRIVRTPGQPLPPSPAPYVLLNAMRAPTPLTLLQAFGQMADKYPRFGPLFAEQLEKSPPEDPLVLATRGRQALRAGRHSDAIPLLRRALEKGYRVAATYEDLGDALARASELDDAIKVLKEGLTAAPFSQTLYKSLALRYIKQERYAEARQTLSKYIDLFPEDDFVRKLLKQVSGQ
ncbi:MAG: tetratricopeptide repeat protein [Bryobacteraceae bacterium]